VQLRQDNALGTLFNMVGFQTKLKYGAQTDVFRMIPGLENAQFARLGGLHRNTFLNSPKLLDKQMRLKAIPRLRFAGQVIDNIGLHFIWRIADGLSAAAGYCQQGNDGFMNFTSVINAAAAQHHTNFLHHISPLVQVYESSQKF